MSETTARPVVVTGANGLVGSRVVGALAERGIPVRGVVRRAGTAPDRPGVEEQVGDFADPGLAAAVCEGAIAVVTTVHPMGSDRATQHEVGVEGTTTLAQAAARAGVARLVHVSTAAVYERTPETGDVAEDGVLVDDDGGDYPATKRQTDDALADMASADAADLTRVLVRPPAILGPGESSVWNALRPASFRDDPDARSANPEASFPWVHVDDLAAMIVAVATGEVADAEDADTGPVPGGCTAVNVAGAPATQRHYYETLATALGVEAQWDESPAWTGQLDTARAQAWGWSPRVTLGQALEEIAAGLR